jgi:hypothetical protein
MSDCEHGPDYYWVNDEKKSYCCRCRQPASSARKPTSRPFVGRGLRQETPTFGFHADHSGYQVDGGYWHCGADQT